VLRYTPISTAFANTNAVNNWYVATGVLHTVYAMVRCNTAAAVYTVRLQDGNGNAITPDVSIDSAVLNLGIPTPICLGTFANPGGQSTAISGGGARLSVAASTIAGGPTLDIDCFVVVCLDDELARVIELTASPSNFSSPNSDQVTFDPRALTKPKPDVVAPYAFPFGGEYSYRGNIYLQAKNALRAFLLAPGGAGPFFTAYWRYTNGAGAALAFTWSASRPVAYLIPQ